jgi:hypothetical protein
MTFGKEQILEMFSSRTVIILSTFLRNAIFFHNIRGSKTIII